MGQKKLQRLVPEFAHGQRQRLNEYFAWTSSCAKLCPKSELRYLSKLLCPVLWNCVVMDRKETIASWPISVLHC